MASTITITILLTIGLQLCLAAFLLFRFPGRVRRAFRFLIDLTGLVQDHEDGPRHKRRRRVAVASHKLKPQLVAIDRAKPAQPPADQVVADVIKDLVDLGANKTTAQQIVEAVRTSNPAADRDALLCVCFTKLRAA